MSRARGTARRSERGPAHRAPDAASRASWAGPREPYLIPVLFVLLTRLAAFASLRGATEDAYITFRFSRNLAAGIGAVYNPGERVQGFSSPLWTIWNALGIALIRDPVIWSRATGLLADLVTLAVVTRLLDRHVSRASAWCFAVFFALWPYFPAVTASGMENAVMLCLIALAAALLDRGSVASGAVLGLLALTRPEGIVSAAVMAVWARGRARAIALAMLIIGVGALWAYYGTPVPQSVVAKSSVYGLPGPVAGRVWWDWLLPMRLGAWPAIGDLNLIVPITVLMAPAAFAGLVRVWSLRSSGLGPLSAGTLVVWAGYSLMGVAYFYWYLLVPLAGIAVLAAVGLPALARGRAVYVSLVLCVLGTWTIARLLYVGRARKEALDFGRAALYLREHARPGEVAVLEPIGLIGYRNPALRVVDEVGLVSPQVARRRLAGPGWYTDVIEGARAEWVLVRRAVLERGGAYAGAGAPFRSPAERDSLLARYTVVDPGNDFAGDEALIVLRRGRPSGHLIPAQGTP